MPQLRNFPQPAHVPVLLQPCLQALKSRETKVICDCTFGNGGYSKALLELPNSVVIALDQDPLAIERANEMLALNPKYRGRFFPIQGNVMVID
jgi:16S rRNA (cytosine1402-N4)-methyltransferase